MAKVMMAGTMGCHLQLQSLLLLNMQSMGNSPHKPPCINSGQPNFSKKRTRPSYLRSTLYFSFGFEKRRGGAQKGPELQCRQQGVTVYIKSTLKWTSR